MSPPFVQIDKGSYGLRFQPCPSSPDSDADGHADVCDCQPNDPAVYAPPGAVSTIGWDVSKTVFSWDTLAPISGTATAYDVIRGALGELPVGAGIEYCVESGGADTMTTDSLGPVEGQGLWYLVRGRNSCGTGTYGFQGHNGVATLERNSNVCP